ncbi:MAG: FtsX-like permease family protein [Phycisphaerae bacterium]|nr:FtsX-like permease family protein [Phycisphaerae bacterium]
MAVLRASWPFARQSLLGSTGAGRRGRTALLVTAVALSSALVVATSCGLASLESTIALGLTRALGATDARLVHRYGETFDVALFERIAALPDVEVATARLFGSLTLVNEAARRDGEAPRATVQVRGIDVPEDERFREIELESGTRPQTPYDVLIDPGTAEMLKAGIGDTVSIQRFGPAVDLRVCGVLKRPRLGTLQRPIASMARSTLGEASGRENELTVVAVILERGTDVEAWCKRHKDVVEEPMILEPAERISTGLDRQILASRLAFTLAASIAFLSCAFIVAVGLTTAVTEQQREMAIARCIGAARSQLFLGQLLVGGTIAIIGGVLGVPLGIFLAWVLVRVYREQLMAGLAVSYVGMILALAGAVIAGTLGSAYPAWQASRVTPMEALAVRSRPPQPRGLGVCLVLACVAIGMQIALLGVQDTQLRFWLYAIVGIALLHIGYFLAAPVVLWAVTRTAGRAVEALLVLPKGLLIRSVRSMPYRLGFTAGALMVGASVLVSTWSGSESLLAEFRDHIRFADGFVFSTSGLSPAQQQLIEELPGVKAGCPVGYLPVRLAKGETLGVDGLGPTTVVCAGFDPDRFIALNNLEWIRGTPEAAIPRLKDGDAVLVAEQFLLARGLDVGSTIGLGGNAGDTRFEIVGVVSCPALQVAVQVFGIRGVYMEQAVSCVFMDFAAVEKHFGSRDARLMQLVLDDASAETDAAVEKLVRDRVPGASYASGRGIRAVLDDVGGTMRSITAAVSFGALFLACFGVGNVVAAGIASRRHEFGVLRAIGGSPSVPLRLVLGESVLVALAGAVTGTALGMHLAAMGTVWHRDLAGIPTQLVFPVLAVTYGCAAMLVMTVLASLPAALSLLRQSPRALLATRS